jgi:hypothetical protein
MRMGGWGLFVGFDKCWKEGGRKGDWERLARCGGVCLGQSTYHPECDVLSWRRVLHKSPPPPLPATPPYLDRLTLRSVAELDPINSLTFLFTPQHSPFDYFHIAIYYCRIAQDQLIFNTRHQSPDGSFVFLITVPSYVNKLRIIDIALRRLS